MQQPTKAELKRINVGYRVAILDEREDIHANVLVVRKTRDGVVVELLNGEKKEVYLNQIIGIY